MASPAPLSRRKTDELAEIALGLGLSDEGQKKQLIERIQNYIDVHGTKDPMLKGLARDDTPDDASGHFSHQSEDEENLTNLSSAYEGDDSDGGIDGQVAKAAFKKTASKKTTSKTTKLASNVDYTGHGAISHIESKLHQAKDLAQQLEETLRGHSHHSPEGHDYTMTNWKNFLWPFFVYYGTLFVLPTLLSQLFNVDVSRPHHTRHHQDHGSGPSTGTTFNTTHTMTGLLSPKTTSGLSYFVFKFAITYLLMPRNHSSHYSGIWQGCKALYEYVPATVGLAISGVGVVLALAESVVSA
ncbi:hypothetical protein BGZ81_005638 [Podila clonocystis]|nr:hypothetical protein BGZ81_005638 [Podila clonocystis]